MPRLAHLLTGFLIVLSSSLALAGSVQEHQIKSKALENNSLGIPSQRQLYVYLPDGYEHSNERYPVIYYLPNFDQKIDQSVITALDKAITKGDIPPVIFVSADFRVKDGINFFGNNEVVGHWLDFIHSELRVWVESNYRVKRKAEHRAISGHFLGAYAAIKLAMLYPDTYGTVYGLHPVATEK
jgi:enterochelin esterase-like enzyme